MRGKGSGIPVSARVVVWVGRMVPVKGLDILLRACLRLRTRDVDYHLYLIGDGPLRRELTAQTEARRTLPNTSRSSAPNSTMNCPTGIAPPI